MHRRNDHETDEKATPQPTGGGKLRAGFRAGKRAGGSPVSAASGEARPVPAAPMKPEGEEV